MNQKSEVLNQNIVPIRKSDRFGVYRAELSPEGEILKGESVGCAYVKQGSRNFRLKLFLLPTDQYFVMPDDDDSSKFVVLSLEEYLHPSGEYRKSWSRIGEGTLLHGFIHLRIQLLPENIYLSLFPEGVEVSEVSVAS